MLKIRLQGTQKDINWFKDLMRKNEKNREFDVLDISDFYRNKGTVFYRVYAEVERTVK